MNNFNVEIRSDSVFLSGYVNAVERESRVLHDTAGEFVEKVKTGVFADAIRKAEKIGLMFNHTRTIGDTENGLELQEDSIGLHARATVTDAEIIEKAKAGSLRGWSFGFKPIAQKWGMTDTGRRLRTLTEIELFEVSILDVTPAYIATTIEMRDDGATVREYRQGDPEINTDPKADDSDNADKSAFLFDLANKKREIELLAL